MEEYRANGTRLGWLIDPEERSVHVYRPESTVQLLTDPPGITAAPDLPGLVLDLRPIWQGL